MEKKSREIRGTDIFLGFFVELIPKWIKPNHLSLARAAMSVPVAFFLWHNFNALAVVFLALAVLLDIFDGALARVRNEQSKSGEWLDTFADKILIIGLLLIFGRKYFPTELIIAVTLIEVLLTVGRPIKIKLGKSGKANCWGKIKMWCQSAAVIGLAAKAVWTLFLANIFLSAALGFAVMSLAGHLRDIFAKAR
jgi:phosphatidylglycerophosphate synthase